LLQIRDRLLMLPLIGALDPRRSRRLTEQVLRGIRSNRAKVVVIDMTGVPVLDTTAASHLVQTVEAARLLGATAIMSGLSAELAHQLVDVGIELGHVTSVVDLQAALDEAEHILSPRSPAGKAARPE
jgi:rsbT co-antagonist protein RsbR